MSVEVMSVDCVDQVSVFNIGVLHVCVVFTISDLHGCACGLVGVWNVLMSS